MIARNDTEHSIRVPGALWASSMLPEGILERWIAADREVVGAGAPIAVVRIEDALHELMAPAGGRLIVGQPANSVIEPGAVIGHIDAA